MFLSNDTYFQAYSYLEENERGSTLALIVLGGWIESLYIMTNLGEYEEGSSLLDIEDLSDITIHENNKDK